MKRIVPGALAGLVVTATLAAPALGANVGVRVEGDAQTLVPRTVVATTATPVGLPGQPTCPGTSALGALHTATGGDWSGPYDPALFYSVETIKGETHNTANSSYWAFWINYGYASVGLCSQPVQEGDEVLLVPECFAAGCTPASPLRLTGVPPRVAPGATLTMSVLEYSVQQVAPFGTISAPAEGATVTAGGASATTGADGKAQLTFTGAGTQTVQATKPGRIRSTVESTCVTTGSDGACGTVVPSGEAPPASALTTRDTTAPIASFTGLANGKVFKRKRSPRELRGNVTADPSGLKSVRLSIIRKVGERCWAFDGGSERFERHRCGGSKSFRIGDRAEWSYLLPRRLGKGRYTIKAVAIDKVGNAAATVTEIRVR